MCTCSETPGARLCRECESTYVRWNVEEVYGALVAKKPVPISFMEPLTLNALEVFGLALSQKGTPSW
jgi:hypothetical protein